MSKDRRRSRRAVRRRVGRVSYYEHHGAWWVYYRDGQKQIRRRVGLSEADAERVASQANAQLAAGSPTVFQFSPVSVSELRDRFLGYHEDALRSSVSTIRRYRTATQHLVDFAGQSGGSMLAHEISAERFVTFLRSRKVSPNGHPHTAARRLRDTGVRFILETCRSLYGYARRMRHLPPYAENPFSGLQLDRMRIEDSKTVFVFTAETELEFFRACDDWSFPIHFLLAKTGMRPGELVHLLIEDLDFEDGWLRVRNKTELGWRIKTGAERDVPLSPELQRVLKRVVGTRQNGPVFIRPKFCADRSAVSNLDRRGLGGLIVSRMLEQEQLIARELSREERLRLARTVWRDAGAIKRDAIRTSFMRIAKKAGRPEATCPKSWRHTFATLLQDANVDPLIRQITMGHKSSADAKGVLGMTTVYTHTRRQSQKQQIEAAVRLWPDVLALAAQWAEEVA